MRLRINGFYAINALLFITVCVFFVTTGISLISPGDRQETISIIICYVLFIILCIIIVSGRYYSRSNALKDIPKVSVPITNASDLPDAVYKHIHSQLQYSVQTKRRPILDEQHLHPGWAHLSDGTFVDCRKRCLNLFIFLRDIVEKAYPEIKLANNPTTSHIQLLKEQTHINSTTADQLCDIYRRARYSHHTMSLMDLNFTKASLNALSIQRYK
jgi:hypothetical protein